MEYEKTNAFQSIWKHLFRTPHRMSWIDVDGVSTRYLEAGAPDAPPLLLLHGTAGSLENFSANYAAYAEDFRVIGLDLLGCGLTDKPDFDYLIPDYVDHVLGFMNAMGIESASLVGVSLGSWVSAALAYAHPARVVSLAMVSPAGIITDPDEERRVAESIRARRTQAAQTPTWETIAAAMRSLVLHPDTMIDDVIAIRLDIYSDPAMKAAMPHLLAFTGGKDAMNPEQWRNLIQPVLVVAAIDSPNMFLTNARAIAELTPRAQLLELAGCDHWAQFEQAERFNSATIDFFRKQYQARCS
ncbi:alpha/beta fold hydrolase [Cupriavidus basilensis]|nr:alpha/beta fold hydrolase [Cupriavidus basilensis]